MNRLRVLVVEGDAGMRGTLEALLRAHGYDVVAVATGEQALLEIDASAPDALLLDLGVPDIDGIELTARVRRAHELPIIVLSALAGEESSIRALDEGADDYISKPFREGELMARIRAALRRPAIERRPQQIAVGAVRIDPEQHRCFVAGEEVALTPIEFKLLLVLARHADRVVTHHQLLREVWGPARVDEVQYLRVYMKQLRNKIEQDAGHPRRIVTALGVGYRLARV
jgi:two-component system, OmpR family, KDP operon response regulator KdpE